MSDYSNNIYGELFEAQKKNQYRIGNTTFRQRIQKLKKLRQALENTYKQELRDALFADFKKPFIETDLTELYLAIREIKHAISNIREWMKDKKVGTPLTLFGTSSYIKYEPKGVCLIISPWNYPVNLTFSPLVSAIAAGNTAILKPSELTPNTSKVMAKIVSELFPPEEVTVVEGDADVSKELLKLPFNHIFFTGSPTIGKKVMEAAAKNLSSVTLELGGKSPTIIDETADIEETVKSLVFGKFLNTGQTCIAPDYVLAHESIYNNLIDSLKEKIRESYTPNPSTSSSFGRIVNGKHFNRLKGYIESAQEEKATIEIGGKCIDTDNFIEPTVISGLSDEHDLMQEEIFGPILPIKTYLKLEEAVEYINSKERPLALYMYSKSTKSIAYVLKNTRSGGVCINNNELQASNHELPFGGINNSGNGKTHGFFGFQDFSNQKAVVKRKFAGPIELLFPPYTDFKQKMVDWTMRWF